MAVRHHQEVAAGGRLRHHGLGRVAGLGLHEYDLQAGQVAKVALADPFQGDTLKGWVARLEQNRLQRLQDAVTQGYTQGQTTDQRWIVATPPP